MAEPPPQVSIGTRLCQLIPGQIPANVRYGTIRYVGPVENTKGTWLGVEWDQDNRGKHDGSHNGKRYFSCTRSGNALASFIRHTRDATMSIGGISFLDALQDKYVGSSSGNGSRNGESASATATAPQQYSRRNLAEIEIEMPNMDKVSAKVRNVSRLRTVALTGPVERVADRQQAEDGEAEGPSRAELEGEIKCIVGFAATGDKEEELERVAEQIAETIPNTTYLDLSRTLLTTWSQISTITKYLSHLDSLHLHYNRLTPPTAHLEAIHSSRGLQNLRELGLDRTRIQWHDEAVPLLSALPKLTVVYLANNGIERLGCTLNHSRLEEINLQGNRIAHWEDVVATLGNLPHLQRLHLAGNCISSITISSPSTLPSLTHLGLDANPIWTCDSQEELKKAYQALYTLGDSLSNLTSLNAVLTSSSPELAQAAHTWSMHVIARLPRLTKLNGTAITPTMRRDAELWWIGHVQSVIEARVQEARKCSGQSGTLDADVVRRVIHDMEREEPRWVALRGSNANSSSEGDGDSLVDTLTKPKQQNNLKSKFIHVTLELYTDDISQPSQTVERFPLLPTWTLRLARSKMLRAMGLSIKSDGVSNAKWIGVLQRSNEDGAEAQTMSGPGLRFEMEDQMKEFDHWGFDQGDEIECHLAM